MMRIKTTLDKISEAKDTGAQKAYNPLTGTITSGLAGAGLGALSSLALGRDSSKGKRLARGALSGATSGIGFTIGGNLGDRATGGNMSHLYGKPRDELKAMLKEPDATKVYGLSLLAMHSGNAAGGIGGHFVGSWLGNTLLGRPDT